MQLISTPAKLTSSCATLASLHPCGRARPSRTRSHWIQFLKVVYSAKVHCNSHMWVFSPHITKMQCKSTSMVVPLTISVQYDDWKSSTERTLRVPECCYRAVFFHLRPRFTFLFHCGSFSPLCCDPALTVFASKCFGAILCHDGCSLRSRGSWLGGSLVSRIELCCFSTL